MCIITIYIRMYIYIWIDETKKKTDVWQRSYLREYSSCTYHWINKKNWLDNIFRREREKIFFIKTLFYDAVKQSDKENNHLMWSNAPGEYDSTYTSINWTRALESRQEKYSVSRMPDRPEASQRRSYLMNTHSLTNHPSCKAKKTLSIPVSKDFS